MRKLKIWYFDGLKKKTEIIEGTYKEGAANTLKRHFNTSEITHSHGSLWYDFKSVFIVTVNKRQFEVNVQDLSL